jgi:hypothetical protein
MTDINGTYGSMYLVEQGEIYGGNTIPYAVVDDGTQGANPVHPAEENITISGAPSTLIAGSSTLTIVGLGNAGRKPSSTKALPKLQHLMMAFLLSLSATTTITLLPTPRSRAQTTRQEGN